MNKIITFDLYGTLIDPTNLFDGVCEFLAEEAGENPEDIKKEFSEKYYEYFENYYLKEFKSERYYYVSLFNYFIKKYGLSRSEDYYIDYMYMTFSDLKYYDDVSLLSVLKERGYRLMVISNADSIFVRNFFEKNENYFDEIIISEEVKLYKPDIRIFSILKEKYGSYIYVGDNPVSDVLGARKAGLEAVLIDRYGKNNLYRNRVTNIEELLDYLK